jgi:hypothetical protein
MAAPGRQIEPHERAHQHLYPASERRVGVEDLAFLVSGKDAGPIMSSLRLIGVP